MGTILFLPASARRNRKREFREVSLRGTKGRPLTQRHLPTTLQEMDDSSCAAKVRIILVKSDFFGMKKSLPLSMDLSTESI